MDESSSTAEELEMRLFCSLLTGSTAAQQAAALFFRLKYTGEAVHAGKDVGQQIITNLLTVLPSGPPSCRQDAAWALTNIACISKTECHKLVEADGIAQLVEVATDPEQDLDLRIQTVWALGNIAADCPTCKNRVRRSIGNAQFLADIFQLELLKRREVKNVLWSLHNIVRGGSIVWPTLVIRKIARCCMQILRTGCVDQQKDALWVIAHLADDSSGVQTGYLLDISGLIDRIFFILDSDLADLHQASIRVLGNIISGIDDHAEYIILDTRFFPMLKKYLVSQCPAMRRESTWICSNIAACHTKYLHDTVFTDDIMQILLSHMYTNELDSAPEDGVSTSDQMEIGPAMPDKKLVKECLWTLLNMLMEADQDKLDWLLERDVLGVLPQVGLLQDQSLITRYGQLVLRVITSRPHYSEYITEDLFTKFNAQQIRPLFDVAEDGEPGGVVHNHEWISLRELARQRRSEFEQDKGDIFVFDD